MNPPQFMEPYSVPTGGLTGHIGESVQAVGEDDLGRILRLLGEKIRDHVAQQALFVCNVAAVVWMRLAFGQEPDVQRALSKNNSILGLFRGEF